MYSSCFPIPLQRVLFQFSSYTRLLQLSIVYLVLLGFAQLTHFSSMFLFHATWKKGKPQVFLSFQGVLAEEIAKKQVKEIPEGFERSPKQKFLAWKLALFNIRLIPGDHLHTHTSTNWGMYTFFFSWRNTSLRNLRLKMPKF